jgi:hypothetical protein
MEDKLLTLHTNLIKEGYDLPDFNTFKADMGDPIKSKKLHDNLIGEGYDLPDYDTFLNDMGLKKKDSSQDIGMVSEPSGTEQLPSNLETPDLTLQTPQGGFKEVTPETLGLDYLQGKEIPRAENEAKDFGDFVNAFGGEINEKAKELIGFMGWTMNTATDAVNQLLYGKKYSNVLKNLREAKSPLIPLPPDKPFEVLSRGLDYARVKGGAKPLPQNVVGGIVEGTAGVIPDIMATLFVPEIKAGQLLSKAGVKSLSKFGIVLGTEQAIAGSQQAETVPEMITAPVVGAFEGYMNGWMFDNLGAMSSKIGGKIADRMIPEVQTIHKAIDKSLVQHTSTSLTNAVFFGTYGNLEEYLTTGRISPETFATNAGMGLALGVRETGKLLWAKGLTSLASAPRSAVKNITDSNVKPEDLAKQAKEKIDLVESGQSQDREGDLVMAFMLAKQSQLKAVVDEVKSNPDEVKKSIEESTLEDKAKEILIDKVNEVVADNDPKIAEAKKYTDDIALLDDALGKIRDNKEWDDTRKEIESEPLKRKKEELKKKVLEIYGKAEPKKEGESKPQEPLTKEEQAKVDEVLNKPTEEELINQGGTQDASRKETEDTRLVEGGVSEQEQGGATVNDIRNNGETGLEAQEKQVTTENAISTSDTRQNTLENEAIPPGQGKVSSENIPPESTAKTSVKREETRFRKTQVNSLIQDQTLQQQEVAKIVDSKKERYTVLHHEDAVNEAKALIDELGVQGATAELIERTRDMNDFPKRNVARMVLLDFYSKAIVDPNASEGDKKVAFKAIDDLQSIIAKENTKAGQGTSLMRIWKEMQPAGVLEYVRRKIAVSNKKILDKKIGDSTLGEQLDELFNTLDKESQSIIQDILAGKKVRIADDIKTKPPAPRRYVPKERIKQEQDYRKSLIEQYKAAQGGTLSASITGLTKEQIELGGNLVASYIREGYYRLQDIVDKLKSDFKQIGIELNDTQADELLGQPKNNKETYGEFLDRQESKSRMREGEKLASKKISEVITAHWTERDELKRTLAQKLMDEAGLTETEAKRIEKEVLDKFDDEILKRSQKQLTKILGTQKIPTEKKQKGVVGKMIELVNMGALDEDLYRNLFAEKFKLVELNEKNTQEILRLANNIQMASGRGWLERDATIKLAKYIYELYPESRRSEFVDTWIAMSYANMLSGISTSVLNMASAGSNLLAKPIRDLTNISKWLRFIRRGIKEGYTDLYNPFGEMFYSTALYGIEVGSKEAAEVYINGDLNNKYVEDVAKKNQFRVTQLERDKYGKSKRFKPITVNIGGKNIDLNIFNLYKYAGRNLAAQDKLMLTTSYEMEVAHILRDRLRNHDLTGRALTKEVMGILRGEKIKMDEINAELESDVKLYKEMTGNDMTELQKKIRKRELMLDKLPITKEEKEEAELLARSNIFTDDRGGMFATLAQGLGNLANRGPVAGLILKPFVPFTKVVGNVSEYMMDHVPFYGLLRANGMSISTLAKKAMKVEGETAQMGEKGSRAYYEQMGRAWLGTAAFSLALLTLLGTDEEDFIELSGGYNKEGFKQRGRENAMPPYTLRVGNVKISYKNIPALAIPLSLIGNINDGLKLNQAEGDLRDRLTAALLLDAVSNSIFMVKDMSFLDGVQRGTQIMADAASADEKKWESIGEGLIKSYLGFATRPLPQNNNAIQQIWKIFDPTSYSQSDIQGMLGYAMGAQHFIGRPSLDQFGDVITSYPGETLMPYTHWLKIKGTDERWKFLAKYNAIPNKLYNRTMQIESADGIEKRKLEADELFEYTKRTGEHFSNALREYMSNTEKVAKRGAEVIEREKNNGETEKINGVREDIEKLWADAKDKAEIELFRWGSVKEDMPAVWSLIKQTEAYQPYQESKSIEGKSLTKSQLYEFNNRASLRYAKQIESYLKSDKSKSDKTKDSNKDGISNFQDRINEEWADAKNYVSRQMAKELRKSE